MITAGIIAVASASDGVALVQIKAERAQKNKIQTKSDLPGLSSLLPSKVFSAMKAKVEALEHRLSDVQKENIAAIGEKKQQYEQYLSEQQRENNEVKFANKRIRDEIQNVKRSNAVLRNKSHALLKKNQDLRTELGAIRANLTLAQEFLQEGLNATGKQAPELEVLAELAEKDEQRAKTMEKQARLNEIGGNSLDVSLLEFSGHVSDGAHTENGAESAEVLVEVLAAQLSELAKEQNASETVLKSAFGKQKKRVSRERAALLEEQLQLNRSIADVRALHQRLSAAVKHLTKVHDGLLARRKAIKLFAQRLGAKEQNTRASNSKSAKKNGRAHRRVASADVTGTRIKKNRRGGRHSTRKVSKSKLSRLGSNESRHAVQKSGNVTNQTRKEA